jgi:hypothetical protein
MKNIALLIVASLIFNISTFADHATTASQTSQVQTSGTLQSEKMKENVQKRGERSHVKVTLKNGTVVDGNITKIEGASFEVTYKKTAQATTISYDDVKKVGGPGLSAAEKIAIGVGIGIGIAAAVLAIEYEKSRNAPYTPIPLFTSPR